MNWLRLSSTIIELQSLKFRTLIVLYPRFTRPLGAFKNTKFFIERLRIFLILYSTEKMKVCAVFDCSGSRIISLQLSNTTYSEF